MNTKKIHSDEAPRTGRGERTFEMSLPAVVTGIDPSGNKFEERTDLHSISSEQASFWLRTPLMIGSKILLALNVPRTLILEKPLRLCLSGAVVYVRSEEGQGRKQFLSASLDRSYRLVQES